MDINLFNNYGEIGFDYQQVIDDIKNQFEKDLSVSLILVNDQDIQKVNHEFRNLNYSTDVISFESDEEDYLGDIFISVDKVLIQAKTYNHSILREFAFLLVHGILHLKGYNHLNEDEEKEMIKKQEEILNKTNYRRANDE